MKRNCFRLLSVMMAFLLACSMGACELSADVVEECLKNTNQAQSMTYEFDVAMGMAVMGQEMTTQMHGSGRATSNPERVEMDLTQQVSGMTMNIKSFAELTEDEYVQYMQYNDQWIKQTLPTATVSQDPMQAMSIYLEGISSYQKEGEETVAGRNASKYSAVISGDALESVMQTSGALDQMEQIGMTVDQAAELYAGLGDLPVRLWVDEEAMQAVKIELDLTEMMQGLMRNIAGMQGVDLTAMGLSFHNMVLSMTITGYNNVDSIEIPQEAKQQAVSMEDAIPALS